jgi:hypothetical protein
MTRRIGLSTAFLVALASSATAEDVTFRKSKIADAKAKERKVDLIFEGDGKAIALRQNKTAVAIVPDSAIDQLAYGYSKRHRVKEGGQVMLSGGILWPAALVSGSVMMLTKTKSHWFYIDYTDVSGPRQLILRLDKSEYQKILEAAKAHTGKAVDILPEQ